MQFVNSWALVVLACCSAGPARAQLEILTNAAPQCVFAAAAQNIPVTFHNPDAGEFAGEIRTRLIQTTSATAVQLGDQAWKKLQVLPGQTVLESAALDFPAVKAETRFLVQWLENSNHVIGTTEVRVYPANLLAELKPLLGEETLGVLDPNHELKPLLKQNGAAFVDLGEMSLEEFSGKLAIIGPFRDKTQMREGLARSLKVLASRRVAVVWLLPPPEKRAQPAPSFYSVPFGTNAVVVAQAEMVSQLPENPQAQLNLIYFCKQALQPQPSVLDPQP